MTPDLAIAFPEGAVAGVENRVVLFNPLTRRWGAVQTLGGPHLQVHDCSLPSGRILVAAGNPSLSGQMKGTKVYLSNAAGTQLDPVSTQALGNITAVFCAAGGPDVFVSTGQDPASLYSLDVATVNGSSWSVASGSQSQSAGAGRGATGGTDAGASGTRATWPTASSSEAEAVVQPTRGRYLARPSVAANRGVRRAFAGMPHGTPMSRRWSVATTGGDTCAGRLGSVARRAEGFACDAVNRVGEAIDVEACASFGWMESTN